MGTKNKSHLISFFILSYLLTWIYALHAALLSHGIVSFPLPEVFRYIAAYGPAIAASSVALAAYGSRGLCAVWKRLLVWQVSPLWYGVALLAQPVVWLVALGIGVLVTGHGPDFNSLAIYRYGSVPPGTSPLAALAPYFALQFVSLIGEEAGWRGYALPRLLEKYDWLTASVILFAGWALWHGPLFFIQGSTQADLPVPLYLIDMLATTFLLTWLFIRTKGSILLATLLHASINTFTLFLPILPSVTGEGTAYHIGIGLKWLLTAAIVIKHWPKRFLRQPETT